MPEEKVIPTHDEIRATFEPSARRSAAWTSASTPRSTITRSAGGSVASAGSRSSGPLARATGPSARRPTSSVAGVLPRRARTATASTSSSATGTIEHQVCWLSAGNPAAQWGGAHVTIQYANGEGFSLAKCWRNDAPRREPHTYTTTWTKSKLSITGAGVETGEPTEEKETHTLEADSPEECDAWDVWVEELKTVRQLLLDVWMAAEIVTV